MLGSTKVWRREGESAATNALVTAGEDWSNSKLLLCNIVVPMLKFEEASLDDSILPSMFEVLLLDAEGDFAVPVCNDDSVSIVGIKLDLTMTLLMIFGLLAVNHIQ
jgi:hypothetical protein